MDGLPELNLPEDWEQRSPVFFGPTRIREAGMRRSLIPLVSRVAYDAQRDARRCPIGEAATTFKSRVA
jgi:hypothetical protein